MIPTQIIATGDLVRASTFEGFAREKLRELRERMSFNDGVNEDHSVICPFNDVVIECWSSFNLSSIFIHVDLPAAAAEKTEKEKDRRRECLCLPHFSLGKIKAVIPDVPISNDDEQWEDFAARQEAYKKFSVNGRFLYDVYICAKDAYVLYEGMYSTGWGRYFEGQLVIVSVGSEMHSWSSPLDCDRACLVNFPRFDVLIITSLHVTGHMKLWEDWVEWQR